MKPKPKQKTLSDFGFDDNRFIPEDHQYKPKYKKKSMRHWFKLDYSKSKVL